MVWVCAGATAAPMRARCHAIRRLGGLYKVTCGCEISRADFDAAVQGWINRVRQVDSPGLRADRLAAFALPLGAAPAYAGRGANGIRIEGVWPAARKKIRRRCAAHSDQQFSGSAFRAPAFSYSMGETRHTRNPMPPPRSSGAPSLRPAARRPPESSPQEPPRSTREAHDGLSYGPPSFGALPA